MPIATLTLTIAWASLHSLLHGFSIASLNGVQDSVTCGGGQSFGKWGLRSCLDIDASRYGLVVTIFTLGGLLGSLAAAEVTKRYGRVRTLRIASVTYGIGTAVVGLANSMWVMLVARIVVGLGSGLVMVTVPLFLTEIAPQKYRTSFGIFHQVSIGLGMILAQSLSLPLGKPWAWRWVLAIGAGIGAVLFLVSWTINTDQDSTREDDADEETPLLPEAQGKTVTVKDLFNGSADRKIRRGVLVVATAQFAQQICGISPIMYFSTRIFTPLFQGQSKLVALLIMAIGLPFNFLPALLPKRIGSRRMLLISSLGTALTTALVGVGLNLHNRVLSATSVIAFVLLFSAGLAPVAWVVLSEVVSSEARTAAGVVAVSTAWITNFAAGSIFLPLQQLLKNGDEGEGNIFFVFTGFSVFAIVAIWTSYRLYNAVDRQVDS